VQHLSEKKILVLISGKQQAGKDTAADYLVREHGFRREGFADALKRLASADWGIPVDEMNDQNLKNKPLLDKPVFARTDLDIATVKSMGTHFRDESGKAYEQDDIYFLSEGRTVADDGTSLNQLYWTRRAICVHKGQTLRTIDQDVWVKSALRAFDQTDRMVIPDARMPNEIDLVTRLAAELGARVVTIRVNSVRSPQINEYTETALDNYAFQNVFQNDGSLADLYDFVTKAVFDKAQ